ncbi:MAG: hypothetical protein JF616_00515 [Fibrobacteres bacterium]|nr:hypothetical protein [Fibrobacterota bacterium]
MIRQFILLPFSSSFMMAALAFVSPKISTAGPLEDLKPGQWVELPCTNKIRNVLPTPIPDGNGPEKIIDAWNSGVYDTKRDRLLIWGGGHHDYQGNEIYAFDIAAFTWERVTDPSATPVAVHTYDGIEYLPRYDKMFSQGGSVWPTGNATTTTYTFDMASLTWEKRANTPLDGMLGVVSAYNPTDGTVIWDGAGDSFGRLSIYDPAKDTWTIRGSDAFGNYHQTASFDPKRNIFLRLGGGLSLYYDLSQTGKVAAKAVNASGPATLAGVNYPGVDYDPVAEEFVAWHGGADVYSLNMDTKTWSSVAGTGSNPGTAVEDGTFNRWRYVPSRNVFLVVNSIDGNVFAYRNKAGSSAPKAYLDMLAGQDAGLRDRAPAVSPGLSALPGARGLARFRFVGAKGPECPILRIVDGRGRTEAVLTGVALGSGWVEYTWRNPNLHTGGLFAETRAGGKILRARLLPQP